MDNALSATFSRTANSSSQRAPEERRYSIYVPACDSVRHMFISHYMSPSTIIGIIFPFPAAAFGPHVPPLRGGMRGLGPKAAASSLIRPEFGEQSQVAYIVNW